MYFQYKCILLVDIAHQLGFYRTRSLLLSIVDNLQT